MFSMQACVKKTSSIVLKRTNVVTKEAKRIKLQRKNASSNASEEVSQEDVEIKIPKDDGQVRVRFAPSPTGSLHVGGARTALFNWLYAKKTGGKFVLRVEDTDTARSTRESEVSMLEDLKWLGLEYDEGPEVGGEYGPYRQSERGAIYQTLARKLMRSGHVYKCFCTDEELEEMKVEQELKKLPPKYVGKWKNASEEEVKAMEEKGLSYTYRFRVPEGERIEIDDLIRGKVGWDTDTLGDFVILRSNGIPVYNFCVAVDDATMGITHVLRAEEHLPNTLRQALVYDALGFKRPLFGHMSLILAPDRSKLSKRHGATSVGQFKEQGYLQKTMINFLALLGWNDGTEKEIYEISELAPLFEIERITKSPAVFDTVKLNWMNGQHIKLLPEIEQKAMLSEALAKSGVLRKENKEATEMAIGLVKDSIELTEDVGAKVLDILKYPLKEEIESNDQMKKVIEDDFQPIVDAIVNAYESGEFKEAVKKNEVKNFINATGKKLDRKGKRLFMPFRIALTGRTAGPEVGDALALLDKLNDGDSPDAVLLEQRVAILKETFKASSSASSS
jgi:glutamyl-tRNA synthetase